MHGLRLVQRLRFKSPRIARSFASKAEGAEEDATPIIEDSSVVEQETSSKTVLTQEELQNERNQASLQKLKTIFGDLSEKETNEKPNLPESWKKYLTNDVQSFERPGNDDLLDDTSSNNYIEANPDEPVPASYVDPLDNVVDGVDIIRPSELRQSRQFMGNKWKYNPEESEFLSFDTNARMRKANKKKSGESAEKFREANQDPLELALNPDLLRSYISPTGRIQPRRFTGLTAKEQRKLQRAIKLSQQLALLPFCSRYPEPTIGQMLQMAEAIPDTRTSDYDHEEEIKRIEAEMQALDNAHS